MPTETHPDRAVQALIDDGWAGEWDWPIAAADLANGTALVLRVIRDDMVGAWEAGEIQTLLGAERWMNERVRALAGRPTLTGDTTE